MAGEERRGIGCKGVTGLIGGNTGSSPVETTALLALLLIPIGPTVSLFGHLSDAMAAESIARHALRLGILQAGDVEEIPRVISNAIPRLASSWQKSVEHRYSCSPCEAGGMAALEVVVGSAQALQVAGLEPN